MTVQTIDSQNYRLRRKGGRNLLQYPPIFSPDGQSLLVICDNTVRVYNVKTGECSRVLESETKSEIAETLIGIRFILEEAHNLYGCTTLGRVIIWSWEAGGAVLREKKLNLREDTEGNIIPQAKKYEILTFDMLEPNICLISVNFKNLKRPSLVKVCLKTEKVLTEWKLPMAKSKIWQVVVGWTNNNRFAAICDGSTNVYICDLSKPKDSCKSYGNFNDIRVISIAAHPTESCIVIGDALGRAIVWQGDILGDKYKFGRDILHWHTLPVFAVAFSAQGGFLLSGGLERVLVKWHLGSLAGVAQQKETLPRLPGAIRHVALSVPHIAIVVDTNAIVITTPQLRLVSTIIECGGLASKQNCSTSGIVYHPGLDACLVGGRTGRLQLVSTASDDVLYNIDITGVNLIAPTRQCPNPVNLAVTCAAVSADGQWLVTSEYRSDGKSYPEECLKFWIWNNSEDPIELNTCVNFSHGGCKLTLIVINNSSDYAVTAGTDQKFRVWKREFSLVNKVRKVYWNCVTACYYAPGVGASLDTSGFKSIVTNKRTDPDNFPYLKEFKDDFITEFLGVSSPADDSNDDVGNIRKIEAAGSNLELGGVAISQDGSLIAAWFGPRLTLWDSHTCELRSVLTHPSLRPKGVHVVFGNDDASHYLVCSTETCVCVWSLLSMSVRWLAPAHRATLAADRASNLIAVITATNDVFVLTPHNPSPLLVRRSVLEPERGVFDRCVFGPSAHGHFSLYLMTNNSELYVLERADIQQNQLEVVTRKSLPVSNFGALVAEQRTTEVKKKKAADLDGAIASDTHVRVMFSAASHMLPPASLLCTPFLQQLSGVSDVEPQDEEQPEEASSEDDSDDTEHKSGLPQQREFWKVDYGNVDKKRTKKILRNKIETDLVQSLMA